jgi:hypothetical protein
MHRIVGLTALALIAAPCLAQNARPNQAPGGAAPTPWIAPAANVAAPFPAYIDDLPKGLPEMPDPGRFSPQVRAWASMRAAGLARGGEIPEAEDLPGYLRKSGGGILGGMNDADIMALAFMVLMQAAKSAHDDIKSIMEEVKQANEARQQKRRQQGSEGKDDGGDAGGMDSLNLQKLTERRSKILQVLSSLTKKSSETEDSTASNLK